MAENILEPEKKVKEKKQVTDLELEINRLVF
jgi:hypothetical protein